MKQTKLKFTSIQTKLNVALIIIVTSILIDFGIYDYLVTKKRMTDELNLATAAAARQLSGSITVSIWEMHVESGIAAAKAEMTDQRIAGIVVMEKDNTKPFLAVKRKPGSNEIAIFDGNFS